MKYKVTPLIWTPDNYLRPYSIVFRFKWMAWICVKILLLNYSCVEFEPLNQLPAQER